MLASIVSVPLILEFLFAPMNLWTGRTIGNFVRFTVVRLLDPGRRTFRESLRCHFGSSHDRCSPIAATVSAQDSRRFGNSNAGSTRVADAASAASPLHPVAENKIPGHFAPVWLARPIPLRGFEPRYPD